MIAEDPPSTSARAGTRQSLGRRVAFTMAAVAVVLAAPLVLVEILLRFLPVASGLATMPVDAAHPVRRFAPDRTYTFSVGWRLAEVNRGRVNNAGFSSKIDYDSAATSPLFALLGDSYVEALMVPWDSTIQGILSRSVAGRGRVYNFAASGAALSHYLAEAEYACLHYRPTGVGVVVVGNDFDESLLRYKTEPGFHYFAERPGDSLELVRVDLHPGAVRGLLRNSALFRYLVLNVGVVERLSFRRSTPSDTGGPRWVGNTSAATDSVRVATSKRAIREFLDELPRRACVPAARIALLVDGTRPELYAPAALAATADTYFPVLRRFFVAEARARGYSVVDLEPIFIEQFERDGRRFEFPADAHWNAHGHAVAAEALRGTRAFETTFGF